MIFPLVALLVSLGLPAKGTYIPLNYDSPYTASDSMTSSPLASTRSRIFDNFIHQPSNPLNIMADAPMTDGPIAGSSMTGIPIMGSPMMSTSIPNAPLINVSARTNLPPETRIAWLEYLANVYVQCDDFIHAREIIDEMYYWLVERPALRRGISMAVQLLQKRIDERHDCMMQRWGPDACRNDYPPKLRKRPGFWGELRDVTEEAAAHMAHVMKQGRYAYGLTSSEKAELRTIYKALKKGFVADAFTAFQRFLQSHPNSIEKEAVRKFEFVLKLVKFDLENPDNCMPLWQTTCCMDFHVKRRILDAYETLRTISTSTPVNEKRRTPRDILASLEDIPMRQEIESRLLVAARLPEAWSSIRFLHLRDRYVAEACLTLHGITRPALSGYPELLSDITGTAAVSRPMSSLFRTSPMELLDVRNRAKNIYQSCLEDRRLGVKNAKRCQEGLTVIESLENACPYGGYVRIGTFSQVFGNYLFIKCLGLASFVNSFNYARPPLPTFTPQRQYPPPPRSPVPPLTDRHYRLLERMGRLMEEFKDTLQNLDPLHLATLEKLRRWDPRQTPPTERLLYLNRNIDEHLDIYLYKLRRYLEHLRRIGRLRGSLHPRWPLGRRGEGTGETVEQLSQALSDLASDLRHRDNSNGNPYY